jgi:transcriptional regulator with XRE-family HTH domain
MPRAKAVAVSKPSGETWDMPAEAPIGAHIRHARLRLGLTLKELGDQIGCSESFLSKVEHDRARPSLATLHRLVRALHLNVAALFEGAAPDEEPVIIVGPEERPIIKTGEPRSGPGITLLRLVPGASTRLLEANIHVVEPGGSSDGLIQHEGEEMGYVLEGTLELHVLDKVYSVPAHSSFFFSSSLPHGYRNPGAVPASVIWINTPPTF